MNENEQARITAENEATCVCGENWSGHIYEHNFVDAEHYGAECSALDGAHDWMVRPESDTYECLACGAER